MSITNEALAPCSKCGQQTKVTVYHSINVSENPELKEKEEFIFAELNREEEQFGKTLENGIKEFNKLI